MTRLSDPELPPAEIDRRLTWARRRGHPRYLWPEVPLDAWRHACAELAAAVSALLRPGPAGATLETADETALGIAAYTTGLGPWLGWQVEQGRLDVRPAVANLLALHLRHGRVRADRREQRARTVIDALAAGDVPSAVFKGAQTAHTVFPEPGTRVGTDIDLLIDPEHRTRAATVMRGLGFSAVSTFARPARTEWRRPDERPVHSLSVHHGDDGIGVDLHASLARTFFGARTVSLDGVPGSTPPFPPLGDAARQLDPGRHLALLLLHTSEDWKHLQLVKLVEIVLTVHADGEGASGARDLAPVLDACDGWRFVYPAAALTERLAPDTIDPGILERAERAAPPRMRRVVRDATWAGLQQLQRVSLASRFMWAGTLGETLRIAAALAWPARTTADPWPRVLVERWYRAVRGTLTLRSR